MQQPETLQFDLGFEEFIGYGYSVFAPRAEVVWARAWYRPFPLLDTGLNSKVLLRPLAAWV